MSRLRIGTRGSQLAMWQARFIQSLLTEKGYDVDLVVIKTTGDKIQDRFLHEIGGKGVFIKELEQALLDGQVDLCIHSLKDMTASLPDAFELAAVLKRHHPGDAMIFRKDIGSKWNPPSLLKPSDLLSLPPLNVGTGSLRRSCLLKKYAPHFTSIAIRGNVDTRLSRLQEGAYDAIVLAQASLERLGLQKEVHFSSLTSDWFVPSPSQGALALETLKGSPTSLLLKDLNDDVTFREVSVERGLLKALGGDCTLPFSCHTVFAQGKATVQAGVYAQDGLCAFEKRLFNHQDIPVIIQTMHAALEENGAPLVYERLNLQWPSPQRLGDV